MPGPNGKLRVGNDVVDLGDPAIACSHLRDRFVERVCHEGELSALRSAREPKEHLWMLFAAKEAAYKVAVKLGPAVFAHRRFVVARDFTSVRYGDLTFNLRVVRGEDHVHAVASSGGLPDLAGVGTVSEGVDSSFAARCLLRSALARRLCLDAFDLEVVRPPLAGSFDGFAPPHVEHRGTRLATDVSLSHDGRFVAFAAHHAGPRHRPEAQPRR